MVGSCFSKEIQVRPQALFIPSNIFIHDIFRHTYLLLGMEDGRILFMDPVIKGQKYMELKASKDAVRIDLLWFILNIKTKTSIIRQKLN